MNAQTVRNIVRNTVKKFGPNGSDGPDIYKRGSNWIIPIIPAGAVDIVIDTLFYALPSDYRIEHGTTITGHYWVKVWASIKADFTVIHFSFDNVEKRDN